MSKLGPDWSHVHQKKSIGFWSLPLAVCSVLYGAGSIFRPWLYSRGVFKKKSLPGFVVSIGNITAGGTGKTPAVSMIAKWAQGRGYRVAILSRGYGGRYSDKVLEVSDGNSLKADPVKAGDEPYLLAKKLTGIPLIISKRRYLAGSFAHERYGSDFFILDDGFQHLELHRDLNIMLIDAATPFGNGHLLPWGPLREPISQLARADVFIFTRASHHGCKVPVFFSQKFPSIPIFYADHLPSDIVFPHSSEVHEPRLITDKPVLAFAGIARPELFRKTLSRLGAEVVYFRGFKDHYPFGRNDIQAMIQIKERTGARYLLTTEKDWMRIASLNIMHPDMAYMTMEFVLLSDHDRFFKIITDRVCKVRRG